MYVHITKYKYIDIYSPPCSFAVFSFAEILFRGRNFFRERIFFRGKTAKQYSFAEKNRETIFFRGKNRETIYLTAKECSFAKILFRGRFEYEMTAKEQGELYIFF